GYPMLIAAVSSLRPRGVKRGDYLPQVSVIITAFNEERALAAKLENTLALDYPRYLLEVIVASDCSADRTDEIAKEFALRGVKLHESRACSLIGVSGCLYAVRRSSYVTLADDACSDFIIATKMVEQGLRAVFEANAICTEETNERPGNEMKMRVRVIAQTFSDLWRNRTMMNPFRSGLYAWQLFSHKVMRYFVPFFLLALLGASATLSFDSPLYRIVFLLQMLGYSCAVVSW